MLELNKLYNMDCMQGMKEFPDGFFDLAIVDPPYGIGIDGQKKRVCGNPKHNRKEHIRKSWDKTIPPPEYFRELERVSKAQVIWGGNYFVPYLEQGHKGWLVWDKGQHGLTMSDSPVWEDCTNAVVQGVAHVFTNKINTAAQYGMNIRVTVQRGDALTACWVSGIGGNFE